MKVKFFIVEMITGCTFGFEFVDDDLLWVLHLGFIRVMRFVATPPDETTDSETE